MTQNLHHGSSSPLQALSRRSVLITAGASVLGFSSLAVAQQKKGPPTSTEISLEELLKAGPLPELSLGKADAPVTIVEYASLSCGHCAAFHNTTFPKLKEKYIDSGKVRFILREFPLDNRAAAASMLSRCVAADKTYPLITELFAKQESWAFVQGTPVPALFQLSQPFGLTKEAFDKCLTDQALLGKVEAVRDRANKSFGVRSTPTFFVNGRRLDGNPAAIETFDKAIEDATKTAAPAAAPTGPAEKK